MPKNSKLNLILLAILIVAGLAVWQIKQKNVLENEPQNKTEVEFLNVNKDKIQKIEISSQGQVNKLRKTEKGWVVEDLTDIVVDADSEKIENLMKALTYIETAELVSKNLEKLASFGLDEASVARLKITEEDSEEAQEVLIGKDDFSRLGTYIKMPKQNEIYSSKQILSMAIQTPEWRDLKIVKFDKDRLNRVSFDYQNQNNFALLKNNGQWGIEGGDEQAGTEIEKFLESLSVLAGEDLVFGKNEEELGLTKPVLKIILQGEGMGGEMIVSKKFKQAVAPDMPDTVEQEQFYYYIFSQGKIFKIQDYQVEQSLIKEKVDFQANDMNNQN